jgi:putative ABC transport system ATP-binding protein
MPLLEFKDVKKIYTVGETTIEALRGVNFSVNAGQLVVVLGASGAGKSTILNLLGGMDRVSSGEIIVQGERIDQYNERRLTQYRRQHIGFVFQFYNLINNLTALENVEFASSIKKDSLNPKEILERVGLNHRANNFPTQLSGGEQQRVAIARAVAKNPSLLLCDEPTGALDDVTGRSVLELLDDINRSYQKTVVLITHNAQIAQMADLVVHVRNGTIDLISANPDRKRVHDIDWQ